MEMFGRINKIDEEFKQNDDTLRHEIEKLHESVKGIEFQEVVTAHEISKSDTYHVNLQCYNCGQKGHEFNIRLGEEIGEFLKRNNQVCKNCGCKTLFKSRLEW